MGWDARAEPVKRILCGNDYRIADAVVAAAFDRAADSVMAETDDADGALHCGNLELPETAYYLSRAVTVDRLQCVYEGWWSPGDVRLALGTARWPEPDKPEDLAWILSARRFLETCVEFGLGISFSS